MTVPLRAYLNVERALSQRLVRAWRPAASAAFATVRAAIATGNFDKARSAASVVNMVPAVEANKEWVKYTLYAAAKFGAMMANPGNPAITLGAYENLLNRAYNTLLLYVTHAGNNRVRDRALQSIAVFEDDHKKFGSEKRPLYVRRDVLNGDAIVAWAKEQGFDTTLTPGDMHVTIVYSKEAVDWKAVPDGVDPLRKENLHFMGGERHIDLLGANKDVAVLKFTSHLLQANWKQWREAGASWDFPSYQPHITISYNLPEGLDVKAITPYAGAIDLGPEVFQQLDEDWKDGLVEKDDPTGKYLAPPSQVTQPDGTRFVKDFVSFADSGDKALQLISSLHTSRLAAWGFTTEADILGITEYELQATLDNRTSAFCSEVADGRRFSVESARRKLVEVLSATDPEDLKILQPWPDQSKDAIAEYAAMSNQELADLGLLIPPFHPRCRTLLARVKDEEGGTSEGPIDQGQQVELPDETLPTIEDSQSDLAPDDGTPLTSIITAAAFATFGILVTDKQVQQWNDIIGLDPAVVFDMLDGVDPQDLLDELSDIDVGFDDGELSLSANGPLAGDDTEVSTNHVYDPATGVLYLNFVDFQRADPAEAENYLRTVYAGMSDLGDTLEASSIEFHASEDTVGAAAVFGAAPINQSDWDSFREYAIDNIAPDGDLSEIDDALTEEDKAVIFDLLSSSNPLAAVALAALPFDVNGRPLYDLLFTGQSWVVGVNLTDPDLVSRYNAFLNP